MKLGLSSEHIYTDQSFVMINLIKNLKAISPSAVENDPDCLWNLSPSKVTITQAQTGVWSGGVAADVTDKDGRW